MPKKKSKSDVTGNRTNISQSIRKKNSSILGYKQEVFCLVIARYELTYFVTEAEVIRSGKINSTDLEYKDELQELIHYQRSP